MAAPIKLGYWKIRGIAQPIRLLLEYLDVGYTEQRYAADTVDEVMKSQWFKEKHKLGLEFPNLPYLMDEDKKLKLTHSNAITRYICHKYEPDCLGKNVDDMARVEMVYGVLSDVRGSIGKCLYGPKDYYPKALDKLQRSVLPEFGKATARTLSARKYLAGDYVTYIDFILYELYDVTQIMTPGIFADDHYQPLREHANRIISLPKIETYMKSEKFISRPINGPSAHFN